MLGETRDLLALKAAWSEPRALRKNNEIVKLEELEQPSSKVIDVDHLPYLQFLSHSDHTLQLTNPALRLLRILNPIPSTRIGIHAMRSLALLHAALQRIIHKLRPNDTL